MMTLLYQSGITSNKHATFALPLVETPCEAAPTRLTSARRQWRSAAVGKPHCTPAEQHRARRRSSSLVAMGITAACSEARALLRLRARQSNTQTIKRCSWGCRCSTDELSFPPNWGGWWQTPRDEKCHSSRQLGPRLLEPSPSSLSQDDACHVCVCSGESVISIQLPACCLFLILQQVFQLKGQSPFLKSVFSLSISVEMIIHRKITYITNKLVIILN